MTFDYLPDEGLLPRKMYNPRMLDSQYKDIFFLFLFGVNVVVILSIAFSYGITALSHEGPDTIVVNNQGVQMYDTSHDYDTAKIIMGIFLILLSAGLMASLWILFLSKFASFIMSAVLMSIILATVLCAIGLVAMGFFTVGICFLVLGAIVLVGSLFLRPRIDFAAANLRVACESITHMPSTVLYALLVLLAQIAFILLWAVAAAGYATNNYSVSQSFNGIMYRLDECTTYRYSTDFVTAAGQTLTCSNEGTCTACVCSDSWVSTKACFTSRMYLPAFFGMLLSLFWTSAVCANIVHCTTAASVATWWATPTDTAFPDGGAVVTKDSFVRACSSSLGSICLGSLLVAVVRTLRTFLYLVAKRMRSISNSSSSAGAGPTRTKIQLYLLRVFETVLRVLDRVVGYFNRYAFCFVAIYGHDFVRASRAAADLFRTRGWTALLNDDIIDLILNLGNAIVGALSMCVGYYYGRLVGLGRTHVTLLSLLGLFGGYLLSMVVMATISSAVATVYVCFAEHPEELEASHPEHFETLTSIWRKVFSSDQPGKGGLQETSVYNGEGDQHRMGGDSSPLDAPAVYGSDGKLGPEGASLGRDQDSGVVADQSSDRIIRGSYRPPLPSDSEFSGAPMRVSSGSEQQQQQPRAHPITSRPIFGTSAGAPSYSRVSTAAPLEMSDHSAGGQESRFYGGGFGGGDRDGATNGGARSDFFKIPLDLFQAAASLLSHSSSSGGPHSNNTEPYRGAGRGGGGGGYGSYAAAVGADEQPYRPAGHSGAQQSDSQRRDIEEVLSL